MLFLDFPTPPLAAQATQSHPYVLTLPAVKSAGLAESLDEVPDIRDLGGCSSHRIHRRHRPDLDMPVEYKTDETRTAAVTCGVRRNRIYPS
jgi:hypothetical protein